MPNQQKYLSIIISYFHLLKHLIIPNIKHSKIYYFLFPLSNHSIYFVLIPNLIFDYLNYLIIS